MSERHGLVLQNMIGPLLAANKIEEALACAEGATKLAPGAPEPWSAKSAVLLKIPGRESEAMEAAREALALDKTDPIALHNYALAQMKLYAWEGALATINAAHQSDPSNPYHVQFAASLCQMLGDYATARKLHTGAINLFLGSDRNDSSAEAKRFLHDAYVSRGTLAAQLNDWLAYFADMEQRYKVCPYSSWIQTSREHHARVSMWGVNTPTANDLILAFEHGLGDQIQALRNVKPMISALDLKWPLVACSQSLADLVAASLPATRTYYPRLTVCSEQIATHDQIELWNFQRGEFPLGKFTGPYLHSKVERGPQTKLRVAICWQGNPNHHFDWARSIPVRFMADWLNKGAYDAPTGLAEVISIQYGPAGPVDPFAVLPSFVENAAPQLGDMQKLADKLATCDVVIGPDTGALHLAGAMGIPAVMLHCYAQDWRWTLEEPLYNPSFRHIRQPKPGDWAGAFAQLDNEIDLALQASHSAEALEFTT